MEWYGQNSSGSVQGHVTLISIQFPQNVGNFLPSLNVKKEDSVPWSRVIKTQTI